MKPEIQNLSKPIILSNSNITMSPIYSRVANGTYKVAFSLILFSYKYDMNDLNVIRRIDKRKLKEAIINSIKPYDKDYMILTDFNTKIATFEFDYKKWFRDTTMGIQPRVHLSKFEKAFYFKKQIPRMIAYGYGMDYFEDFIVKKFKETTTDRKFASWFDGFISKEYAAKIKTKIPLLFDYEYDYQNNKLIMRLKNIYILGLLFAVGNAVAVGNSNTQPYVKVDFEKKVKGKIALFDKKKWESFINKRYI